MSRALHDAIPRPFKPRRERRIEREMLFRLELPSELVGDVD